MFLPLGRFSRPLPLSVMGPLSTEDPVVVDDELGRQKRTRVEPEPRQAGAPAARRATKTMARSIQLRRSRHGGFLRQREAHRSGRLHGGARPYLGARAF